MRACVRERVCVCVRPRAYHSVWARMCERLLDLIQGVLIRRTELFELFNIPVPTLIFAIKELRRAIAHSRAQVPPAPPAPPVPVFEIADMMLGELLETAQNEREAMEQEAMGQGWDVPPVPPAPQAPQAPVSEIDEPEAMEQHTQTHAHWLSETDEPEAMEQDAMGHGSHDALLRFDQEDAMWSEEIGF